MILLLGITGLLRRKLGLVMLFAISVAATSLGVGGDTNVYWTPARFIPQFFMYFGIGALAYHFRDRVPMNWAVFLLAVGAVVAGSPTGGYSDAIFVFLLAYIVLFIGLNPRLIRLSSVTSRATTLTGFMSGAGRCNKPS